jgi:hypothetical protein
MSHNQTPSSFRPPSASNQIETSSSPLRCVLDDIDSLIIKFHPPERFALSFEAERLRQVYSEPCPLFTFAEMVARGLTPRVQGAALEALMITLYARTSSTYGALPHLVADLAFSGYFVEASILNKNAAEEIGVSQEASHPLLLAKDFFHLSQVYHVSLLTPLRYALARTFWKNDELERVALARVSKATEEDLRCAQYFSSLLPSCCFEYHEAVRAIAAPHHHSSRMIPAQLLECALREAESADPESFIGGWRILYASLMKDTSTPDSLWAFTHHDEAFGRESGWEESVEEGHADDARGLALSFLQTLEGEQLTDVIRTAVQLQLKRHALWQSALGSVNHHLTASKEHQN